MARWVSCLLILVVLVLMYIIAPHAVADDDWIDPYEQECLALNIYHEARGESWEGMLAVAHVTVNRMLSPRFPDTLCGVVFQGEHYINWKGNVMPVKHRCQFSWYCDGRSDEVFDKNAWKMSIMAAQAVLLREVEDNTDGATHYFNPAKADPWWQDAYIQTTMVDSHLFLRSD